MLQDQIALEIARLYADQRRQPIFVAVGYFPDYDVISRDREFRMEIKCETTSIRTGMLAFEYWDAKENRASGALGTVATHWLHIALTPNGLEAFEFPIAILRKMILEQGHTARTSGDMICRLIPIEICRLYATRVFPFRTRFLDELLETTGVKQPTQHNLTEEKPENE
jgi:hypothetical protein